MIGRSRAREIVFQILFQGEFQPAQARIDELEFIANRLQGNDKLIAFAQNLLAGVRSQQPQIDEKLKVCAKNWSMHRMAPTDRSALRLGAYEIIYADTPAQVAINEAIELAKRFGTESSGSFVNGILDRLIKDQNLAASPETMGQDNLSTPDQAGEQLAKNELTH